MLPYEVLRGYQTFLFQISSCGEKPRHRRSARRYVPLKNDSDNDRIFTNTI